MILLSLFSLLFSSLPSSSLSSTLSYLKTATITIEANDEASGVISFVSNEDVTLLEPASDLEQDTRSEVILTLLRAPGIYNRVEVIITMKTK